MPTGSDYSLELDPLSHNIIPSESKFEVLSTKIEIQLKKERLAVKWGALEGDDTNAGSMATTSGMIYASLFLHPCLFLCFIYFKLTWRVPFLAL